MPPAPEPVRVPIHGLSSNGAAVGRTEDGLTVFVPFAAPEEEVLVTLDRRKKRWASGHLNRVETQSPHRREPRCAHFTACGGCAFQHISYEEQLRWKGRFIGDALRRIGGLDLPDPVVSPAPSEYGYRNRVTFTLANRKGRVFAGLHQHGRPGRVEEIRECHLADPRVQSAWNDVRRWVSHERPFPRTGVLRLTIRLAPTGVALIWRPACPTDDPEGLLDRISGATSVWEHREGRVALLAGTPGPPDEEPVPSFQQVNPAMGALVEEALAKEIGDPSGMRIVDAYGGVARTGRTLAAGGGDVVVVDVDGEAVDWLNGLDIDGLVAIQGPVEEVLSRVLPADCVVVNPPRDGLAAGVSDTLVASGPPLVVYQSCDPATLGRDLARLRPAYRIRTVAAFDMFPQTSHVETLVALERQ